MPAMCDHAADGSEKGDTTIDDGIVQDRRLYQLYSTKLLNFSILKMMRIRYVKHRNQKLIVDKELLNNEKNEEWQFLNQLFNPQKIPQTILDVPVSVKLRSYQQEGLNWLDFLNRCKLHGVLCDDMGLGKTLQTLCILAVDHHRTPIVPPSIIICPPTLIGHWIGEVEKFFHESNLSAIAYVGNPQEHEEVRRKARRVRTKAKSNFGRRWLARDTSGSDDVYGSTVEHGVTRSDFTELGLGYLYKSPAGGALTFLPLLGGGMASNVDAAAQSRTQVPAFARLIATKRAMDAAGSRVLEQRRQQRLAELEEERARQEVIAFQQATEQRARELQQRRRLAALECRRARAHSDEALPPAPRPRNCWVCGLPGVLCGRECPNRANHPKRNTKATYDHATTHQPKRQCYAKGCVEPRRRHGRCESSHRVLSQPAISARTRIA
ncbi:unnamed protein product [Trichogramma brassicae]|uniref:Helicase ATP-binding domain-containing protein n=1 Tax=Trichogramma brassicae TaxID=86971 RepID=A0A6H5IP95_9HYME|nr:unnamed protein product [Trichogramma brassicae]